MDSIKPFSNPVKIPLHELLLANGYEIIRSKSTRLNPVLESPNGHRVVISLMPGGDYLYFNPSDNDDKGNIYNLVKNQNLNLSSLLENYFQIPITKSYNIEAKNYNESKDLVDKFLSLKNYNTDINYYLQNRALSIDIINLYNQMIKTDSYHNVYFPQYKLINNIPLVRGYTMKLVKPIYAKDGIMLEKPIKSITKGTKGLEILLPKELKKYQNIIISESIIDSLSCLEIINNTFYINKDNANILIGTGGNLSISNIMETIKAINDKFRVKEYQLAFDNDFTGEKLRKSILKSLEKEQYITCNNVPLTKDFNDDLKLMKLLNIKNYKEYTYHKNAANKERILEYIHKVCDDAFEDFRYAKRWEKGEMLKKIRRINKIFPLNKELKDKFNNYKYKDKRIKEL